MSRFEYTKWLFLSIKARRLKMFGLVYPDCGWVHQWSKHPEMISVKSGVSVGEREGASVDGGVVLTPLTSVLGQLPDRCRLSAFPTWAHVGSCPPAPCLSLRSISATNLKICCFLWAFQWLRCYRDLWQPAPASWSRASTPWPLGSPLASQSPTKC